MILWGGLFLCINILRRQRPWCRQPNQATLPPASLSSLLLISLARLYVLSLFTRLIIQEGYPLCHQHQGLAGRWRKKNSRTISSLTYLLSSTLRRGQVETLPIEFSFPTSVWASDCEKKCTSVDLPAIALELTYHQCCSRSSHQMHANQGLMINNTRVSYREKKPE